MTVLAHLRSIWRRRPSRGGVLVDFPPSELLRVQALAVVLGIPPSQVIRRACGEFIDRMVGSAEYEQALADAGDRPRGGSPPPLFPVPPR